MTPYSHILHCSVCKGVFYTTIKWLDHFLYSSYHQQESRLDLQNWDRGLTLVGYCLFNLSPPNPKNLGYSKQLLNVISTKVHGHIVTDFAWFPERPSVVFIQFESRKAVNQVLDAIGGYQMEFRDQIVHLRRATDCLQLEWLELLGRPALVKEHENIDTRQLTPASDKVAGFSTNLNADEMKTESDTEDSDIYTVNDTESTKSTEDIIEANYSSSLVEKELNKQFQEIWEEIVVPDELYNAVMKLKKSLRDLLEKHYPKCRLELFRYWHLKLFNSKSSEIIFYFYQKGEVARTVKAEELGDVLRFYDYLVKEVALEGVKKPNEQNEQSSRGQGSSCNDQFMNQVKLTEPKSFVGFTILSKTSYVPEVQAGYLLKHMIKFDSRARPLYVLLTYWSKVNSVLLSESLSSALDLDCASAAFEWLIMFFLCYKKIIPLPETLQEYPHRLHFFEGADVGFSTNPKHLRKWLDSAETRAPSNQRFICDYSILGVVQLALEFFQFCVEDLARQPSILNTRNGQIISKDRVQEDRSLLSGIFSLRPEDARKLKSYLEGNIFSNDDPSDVPIFILNPLTCRHTFYFSATSFIDCVHVMRKTLPKLQEFIGRVKDGEGEVKDVSLKNLFMNTESA